MPTLLGAGLGVTVGGGVIDVLTHAGAVGGPATELTGHVVTLAGMVVAMSSVLATATRSRVARPTDGARHDAR